MPDNGCNEISGDIIKLDKDHMWHHIIQHKIFDRQDPLIMVEGKGCMVRDIKGREYLDGLSGGVWCVNAGYGRDSIAEAVCSQLKQMHYYSMSAGNIPAVKLTVKLAGLLPGLQKVFISNSGSEANEVAFKIARQYSRQKYPGRERVKIAYRYRDYHGTTYAALSASGQEERKTGYEPLVPGFIGIPPAYCYRCSFGKTYPGCDIDCARALEKAIQSEGEDHFAAVVVEPITAGGGILIPCDEYFGVIQDICRKYEVLLIIDEVVTGFGRTGKMFGHSHWEVRPDMVTMAKGLASAYVPVSATAIRKEIFDAFLGDPQETTVYFRHISTYGGNAAICAAALENISIIEGEKLCENSELTGRYLLDRLREFEDHPLVGEIRGKGLFAGIELVEEKKTKGPLSEQLMAQVVARALEQGVIIGRMNRSVPGQNNVITLAPPLIITRGEIDRIVSSIKAGLDSIR